jgi:hypothetical protein
MLICDLHFQGAVVRIWSNFPPRSSLLVELADKVGIHRYIAVQALADY